MSSIGDGKPSEELLFNLQPQRISFDKFDQILAKKVSFSSKLYFISLFGSTQQTFLKLSLNLKGAQLERI